MALKKVNVGHTFFLEAPNDTRSTYDFDPMAHLPENTETIEKLVFNVRVSTDPSNPEYYPQFYFNPDGNAGGNYEYPKNHPDNDGYITGDFLYWPTNDDDSWGVAYAPGLTSDQGVFAITHIPDSDTHYLTNSIVVTGAMDRFGEDTWGYAYLHLESVTIHYNGFALDWGDISKRNYETGIDRGMWCDGVFYGRPWPALISVQEQIGVTTEVANYAGQPVHHITNLGEYTATVKAFAKPDSSFYDFHLFEGNVQIRPGVYLGGQAPRIFNFSWRSWVGDPVGGDEAHYKIHIVFNVIAVPEQMTANTESNRPTPKTYGWKLRATPGLMNANAPTSKLVFDSRFASPATMSTLEILVGDYGYFLNPQQVIDSVT